MHHNAKGEHSTQPPGELTKYKCLVATQNRLPNALVEEVERGLNNFRVKVVFHSKFPIFAIFLNIHKASPNTDHNIICMFLKRKTISKPEKSSLSYTNRSKTTILPRANNGIQLVYSIVCNFNSIVLFDYSNICVNFKVDYLEECFTHFQKFS